jgi:peptide chain release factor 2
MDLLTRVLELKKTLKIEERQRELSALQSRLSDETTWKDHKLSAELSAAATRLEREISDFSDLYELAQIADESDYEGLLEKVDQLEQLVYLNGKYDPGNAILSLFAGAGGVDAQDWAEMLLRMYLRFAETEEYAVEIVEKNLGTEAGIKNATLLIKGDWVYGRLRGEAGVHRLVRQSPYNSKNLRQTSFAMVEVIPEIKNDLEVKIDDKDLKIDVFRASGHGGQSVNTTDSAVRITHTPTGISVVCQNQRSQMQNRETALKILKSRLHSLLERQHKANILELKGNNLANEWGSQIRSYIIHPYKLVKDHRTDFESTDPDQVLSGKIEGFIDAYLKQKLNSDPESNAVN